MTEMNQMPQGPASPDDPGMLSKVKQAATEFGVAV